MSTTAKALALAAELGDELHKRLPALTYTTSTDTDGSPLIKFGAATAGAAGFLIKVRPVDWPLAQNVLGTAATIYTPHTCQIVTEANPSAGAGADINTPAITLAMLAATTKRGTKVEWYNSANGNSVDPSDITSGNLVATWDDLYFPMMASQ